MKSLPDTLHELLELALHDFDLVLEDPAYRISMGTWHDLPPAAGTCYVCLAGAVMAKSMGLPRELRGSAYLDGSPLDVHRKLVALDHLRTGDVGKALFRMSGSNLRGEPDFAVTDWDTDHAQWRADMDDLLVYLKEKNL